MRKIGFFTFLRFFFKFEFKRLNFLQFRAGTQMKKNWIGNVASYESNGRSLVPSFPCLFISWLLIGIFIFIFFHYAISILFDFLSKRFYFIEYPLPILLLFHIKWQICGISPSGCISHFIITFSQDLER